MRNEIDYRWPWLLGRGIGVYKGNVTSPICGRCWWINFSVSSDSFGSIYFPLFLRADILSGAGQNS